MKLTRSILYACCIFSLDLIFAADSENSHISWDCGRTDIPYPINQEEISKSRAYIVNIFHLLFYSFLSESDKPYLDGLVFVVDKNYAEAKKILLDLVNRHPNHSYAYVQLAYIYLWEGELSSSYEMLKKAYCQCKCEDTIMGALRQLSFALNLQNTDFPLALDVNKDLLACEPDSFQYKYINAVLLLRLNCLADAEKAFLECLSIAPDDSDVALQLGNLYYRQSKYEQADNLYAKFPERIECIEGRGRIALAQSNYLLAEQYFKQVLQKLPGSETSLLALAEIYSLQGEYSPSRLAYHDLLSKYPENYNGWQQLYDVNLHTEKAINYNISYVEAKENDPNIQKPVAKDYYFDNNIIAYFPINDLYRFDVKTFFAFQKEKNILPTHPGINYYAQISGLGLISHYFFLPKWKWDLFVNLKAAWNVGSSFFPFQNTQRAEPGTYITYAGDDHFLSIGGNVNSYVIKNFSKKVSQLLTLRSLNAFYSYTAPLRCKPALEGYFDETYFISKPHNRRDTEAISIRSLFPYAEEFLKIFYTFEHRHFNKLNINYYSFHQQWRNTAGISLFYNSIKQGMSFDLTYWYRAQKTKDLYQPIGTLIYITPMQYLNCNQVQATFSYRQKDYLKWDLSGGYYRDTLPYRAWNVQSSMYWLF
jgi:Tfp pilus assembly protein PilF